MDKVKLTREQAESLKKAVNRYGEDLTVIRHSEGYFPKEDEQELMDLTTAEIAKALYIGYEVEETFKVGDWVVDRGSVYKIISKHHAEDLNKGVYLEARRATPEEIAEEKQRRWWNKHGREVFEFKTGDLIKCDDTTSEVVLPEEDLIWIKMNGAKGRLPEKLYQGIEVICFAEDRKDLEGENE